MTASPGRALPMSVLDGVRGALAGLAAYAALYLAAQYAASVIDRHPEIDGPETLGSTVLITLGVGIPGSVVLGLLVSWTAGLRRPWAVSLLGLMISGVLICGWGALDIRTFAPPWLLIGTLVVVAYALAAVAARE
ncbi:hypothetical protein [Micromonospora sp. NPDC050200]|uniref:hypothetical protein n=1 Tax=Micromonospora sp. NPDC050200 TaxID=3155664 RepID=UPI0033D78AC3